MKNKFLFIILITFFCSHFSSANTEDNKTILVLGDSISAGYGMNLEQGWVALLNERLKERSSAYTVVNASISGNTSGDGLGRLPLLLEKFSPTIVVIELGGNDGLRGYPVKVLTKNLQSMIDISQQAHAQVLLAGIEIPPNYGQRYTDLFRAGFQEVAANNDVAFIPFILENIALNPDLMQDDGIHPTAEAQPMLLDNIWPTLASML